MKHNKDMRTMAFKIALLLSAASAFAATDGGIQQKQQATLNQLDSLDASILGLRVNGTAKAGFLSSTVDSDQLMDPSTSRENQAHSDVNLVLQARPSSETAVRVELRLHKEWQSAYTEGVNPVVGHWFSYDGLILNKHLAFNLGYMRVAYTPLTIHLNQPTVLQEPLIFAERRVEALEQRNLDTSHQRLMTGLHADYQSGAVGPLSNIRVMATGARMRNAPKKSDQIFFDFDRSDRYMGATSVALSAYGFDVSGNYVRTFDRELSTRSRPINDSVYYENNRVRSLGLGFNTKELFSDWPVELGLQGEYALSDWALSEDRYVKKVSYIYDLVTFTTPNDLGGFDNSAHINKVESTQNELEGRELAYDKGSSVWLQPSARFESSALNVDFKGQYLYNSKDFWSEQAASPTYWGNSGILNTSSDYNAPVAMVNLFRSGNLENLYFTVYESNPFTSQNLIGSTSNSIDGEATENGRGALYNNYKGAHFYRNGYTAQTMERLEADVYASSLDPSVNLAMPFGFATPNRKGFSTQLDLSWNHALAFNVRAAQFQQNAGNNEYSQLALGAKFDVAELLSWNFPLNFQGSFETASESKYLEQETQRIVVGGQVGVYGPVSLLMGMQMLEKKYGNSLVIDEMGTVQVSQVQESLLLAGPRVRLAPGAYLNVQGGLLGHEVSYAVSGAEQKWSVDKTLIMADLTVAF